jgi:voltage-gated potassium channel
VTDRAASAAAVDDEILKDYHLAPAYQLLMLVLCIYAIGVLATESLVKLEPRTHDVLDLADYAVCVIFFADFVVELWKAPDRKAYFFKWGWLDLLSSIPAVHVARWARAARLVRILRLLRALRAARLLASVIVRRRTRNTLVATSLIALLLVVFSSVAILTVETDPESNIKSAEDAVWWSFATLTTVGYGDRYPVTGEGRFVAGILMCSGVGLFGAFSGLLAASFIGTTQEEGPNVGEEIKALRTEVGQLRELIERGQWRPDSRTSNEG